MSVIWFNDVYTPAAPTELYQDSVKFAKVNIFQS